VSESSDPSEGADTAGDTESLYNRFELDNEQAQQLYQARRRIEFLRRRLTAVGDDRQEGLQTPAPALPLSDDASADSGTVEEPPDDSLLMRIIDEFGNLTGKYDPPTSLSTHVINAVVTGTTAFAFDTTIAGHEDDLEERGRLLITALAIHDCNKFVSQRYPEAFADWLETHPHKRDNIDATPTEIRRGDAYLENSEPVLDFYFQQGDPLGLRFVMPGETPAELRADIADVKWLVQRTELYETRDGTVGDATRRVRDGLYRYARIGDAFVSKQAAADITESVNWLDQFYRNDSGDTVVSMLSAESPVQTVTVTTLEQPILNSQIIAMTKAIIEGRAAPTLDGKATPAVAHGVVLGTTPDTVAYLGEPIDRDTLATAVEQRLMHYVTDNFEFDCKTRWNSFEPDILEEISIPYTTKREKIRDGYLDVLVAGSGLSGSVEDGFEREAIPSGFADRLPELALLVFSNRDEVRAEPDAFAEYPLLQDARDEIREGDQYSGVSQNIGLIAELLLRYTGQYESDSGDGATSADFREEFESALAAVEADLQTVLEPEVDAGVLVTQRAFYGGRADLRGITESDTSALVKGSNQSCFLCGRPAERQYKKADDAFYGTNAFSKRVDAREAYKRICSVCNLEHALLRSAVEKSEYGIGDDMITATVYYDAFVGNLGLGQGKPGELVRRVHGVSETVDNNGDDATDGRLYNVADPSITADSFAVQYHIIPLYAPGEQRRLAAIRNLLTRLGSRGFKIAIGKPFTPFRPRDLLFEDAEPSRREVSFGVDRIESYDELRRVRQLLDLLHRADPPGDRFLAVEDDTFEQLAAHVVEHGPWLVDEAHEYFRQYRSEQYMMMKEVAERGIDLYGVQYSDKQYAKVKLFRRALGDTLEGLTDGRDEEELLEWVAGQAYAEADEEDYSGRVTTEQAEVFVQTIFDYLKTNNMFNAERLNKRRNALVKVYEFAYDKAVEERQNDQEATASASGDDSDEEVSGRNTTDD